MKKTLTDRFVAGAHCVERENVFDAHTRGLVLRVSPRAKTWYFTYRKNGPTQWLRLGDYPALKLADARTEAGKARHAIDVAGLDPVVERRNAQALEAAALEPPPPTPAVFTFADFVPVFNAFQRGRVKEWANDAQKIERHVLPVWGALPLREITRTHVHELLDTVAGKGLTIGVNRVQSLISRIFTVALDRSLIDAHPAARVIKRFAETPRDKTLTDDELRALWAGLDRRPGTASDAIRLRVLLAQRGEETAGMGWSEVDLEAATWTLPRPRTKTRKRAHVVPLPPTAVAILKRRRSEVPNDDSRVFPGLSLQGEEHKALNTIHGGAYEWKDTRRTAATRIAELGFDETVIGRLLNHAKYSVTSKHYNTHAYLDEIRQALTAWDVELARILANEPKKRPRVLPMRRRS